jgi:hypothetical protein
MRLKRVLGALGGAVALFSGIYISREYIVAFWYRLWYLRLSDNKSDDSLIR